jgi:hypothetical protein
MKWKLELDALIESTIAFAKDIKGGQPIADLGGCHEDSRTSARRNIDTDPASHDYSANGFASVTTQRNPRARKQFQKAPGKDGAGPRGILFASESKDAGARRPVWRSF